jgi:hypothetical protein
MAGDLKPASIGGRLAWWWCRAYCTMAPPSVRARRPPELLSHLVEAERAGVPGWRLAAEAARGAVDDLRYVAEARRRTGAPPLAIAPLASLRASVALAAGLTLVSYVASLGARYPVPHLIKFAAMRGAGGVIAVGFVLWLQERAALALDGRPLSSYNSSWWSSPAEEKGERTMSEAQRKVLLGLGAALVVTFLLSSIGQDRTPSDGGLYWVGAVAWAAFGITLLATVAFVIATFVGRRRRSQA